MNGEGFDLEKSRRESLRWYALSVLNKARPVGASERTIIATISAIIPDLTLVELRRELSYLADRGLVDVKGENSPSWFAQLTRDGVDVVEYTVECEPGIARPPKYW